MKATHNLILCLAASLMPITAQTSTEQELRSANVTLPYEELKQLLEIAHQQKNTPSPAPPIGEALKSAHFRVSAQPEQGPLQALAEFQVINLSGEWEWTPLLSGVQVDAITPADAMVVKRHGVIGLLHREAGVQEVTLSISGEPLRFTSAEASSCQLHLAKAPKGQRWKVDGQSRRLSESRHALEADEVNISLQTEVAEVESEWKLRCEMLVGVEAFKVRTTNLITLNANEGTGQTASIKLPHEASKIRVKGDDLGDWKLTHDSQGRWLNLHWKSARILNRSIEVFYDLPAPVAGEALLVPTPSLENGQSHALVAVATEEGLVATAPEGRQLNPANLPAWMHTLLPQASEMASQSGKGTFEFKLLHLPRANTADATIRRAVFDMKVVSEGSLLCTANFEIVHRGASRWKFQLPDHSALLSCQRGGEAARPIIAGDKQLSLHLPSTGEDKDQSSHVTLMYTAKIGAMNPVEGAMELTLPSTPLFIQETHWLIRIPDEYRTQAVEGNVEILPTKTRSEGIALKKSFNHGDTAAARIHYRKRGLEE